MFESIDFDKVTNKKLDSSIDLSEFDCTKNDTLGLDQFIHKEALEYQDQNLGITYLFYYNSKIIGFVTLAMGRLRGLLVPEENGGSGIRWFPSLLIGRLATHSCLRDLDIGTYICGWTMGYAKKRSEEIGCKFVVADTDENVMGFYEKNRFMCVKQGDNIVAFRRV